MRLLRKLREGGGSDKKRRREVELGLGGVFSGFTDAPPVGLGWGRG